MEELAGKILAQVLAGCAIVIAVVGTIRLVQWLL